jgi:hypothetical protein
MENNITYLFGAGASYNACPIWKEQGEKMMFLSKTLGYDFNFENESYIHNAQPNNIEQLVWLIGEIGFKAREFSTVDTYARKLYLLRQISDLQKLKKAVSVFFTLWALTNDSSWKKLPDNNGKYIDNFRESSIDPRYINLLATYLERGNHNPMIKSNVRFVTWNYDLQIEAAFNKFCDFEEDNYAGVNNYFPFIPKPDINNDLVVCHLNGFHGFYGDQSDENLFKRSKSKKLKDILESIDFLSTPYSNRLAFNNYVNYAWEMESDLAKFARLKAKEIFSKTDILVIVGYSFPSFNNVVDQELFGSAKHIKRIVFQDPKANKDVLTETFTIPQDKIVIINSNMDQFIIPNYSEGILTPFLEAS